MKEESAKLTEKKEPTRQKEIHEIDGNSKPSEESIARGGSNETSGILTVFLNITILLSVFFAVPTIFTHNILQPYFT